MRLYSSYWAWRAKPEQCPKGMNMAEYSEMPPIVGPMVEGIEIDDAPALDSIVPLEQQIKVKTGAVRVVVISVIQLPIGSNIAVPKIAVPGRVM